MDKILDSFRFPSGNGFFERAIDMMNLFSSSVCFSSSLYISYRRIIVSLCSSLRLRLISGGVVEGWNKGTFVAVWTCPHLLKRVAYFCAVLCVGFGFRYHGGVVSFGILVGELALSAVGAHGIFTPIISALHRFIGTRKYGDWCLPQFFLSMRILAFVFVRTFAKFLED